MQKKINGYSLHIGLNAVDPEHYTGWEGVLNACEADANDMAGIAHSRQFTNVKLLLTKNATRYKVINAIKNAAKKLAPGDIFFISYSGHGGQVPDKSSDESDGMDETWCLYDGQLIDDELFRLWFKFKKGVRILLLSDSCHSGTVLKMLFIPKNTGSRNPEIKYRYMPHEICMRTYRENQKFYDKIAAQKGPAERTDNPKATVRLISGCQDNQYSQDGAFNGLFTGTLLRVWNEGKFSGNYDKFHKKIMELMPATQSPQHTIIGLPNEDYNDQRPFTI